MPSLIAIDIGNSNITIGLLNGSDVTRSWRINTDLQRTADEYRIIIENLVGNGDGGGYKGCGDVFGGAERDAGHKTGGNRPVRSDAVSG